MEGFTMQNTKKPNKNKKTDQASKTKILELFLTNKTYKQTDMSKTTKLSYVTIIKQLDQLKKSNLIAVIDHEPTSAGGLKKKIWALTDLGLFWVLQHTAYEDLEEVIEVYQDKLLIFRKLALFEKTGLLSALLEQVRMAFFSLRAQRKIEEHNYNASFYDYSEGYGAYDVFYEKESAEAITLAVLMPLIKDHHCEGEHVNYNPLAYMKICQDDTELKALVDKQLDKELFEAKARFQELKCVNHVWNKTDWAKITLPTIEGR
jgi:DNA-binding PadR family transcriptional regulator